jgi:hypothetical protein
MLVERNLQLRAIALKLPGDPFARRADAVRWIAGGRINVACLKALELLLNSAIRSLEICEMTA